MENHQNKNSELDGQVIEKFQKDNLKFNQERSVQQLWYM